MKVTTSDYLLNKTIEYVSWDAKEGMEDGIQLYFTDGSTCYIGVGVLQSLPIMNFYKEDDEDGKNN